MMTIVADSSTLGPILPKLTSASTVLSPIGLSAALTKKQHAPSSGSSWPFVMTRSPALVLQRRGCVGVWMRESVGRGRRVISSVGCDGVWVCGAGAGV